MDIGQILVKVRALARRPGLDEAALSEVEGLIETLSGEARSHTWGWADEGATMGGAHPSVPAAARSGAWTFTDDSEEVTHAPVVTPQQDRLGRYEDQGPLGAGGMGEVRRVADPALGRRVAMKILDGAYTPGSGMWGRFVAEAQATAQLEHPGIVPIHEVGQLPDGRSYYTMKEVRGDTLHRHIQATHEGGLTPGGLRRLVEAFRRVCEAMGYAHERGVIHRDIKPHNVMLGGHGEVLVVDWGLARVLGAHEDPEAVSTLRSQAPARGTRWGQVAGTPAYMPPEQARGEVSRLDPASDVYALGAVLYEILSGQPPYRAEDAETLLDAVKAAGPQPLAPPAVTPQELVDICERAMHRQMESRFADAGALGRAVADWLEGALRRKKALAQVAAAGEALGEAEALRRRAEAAWGEADALLDEQGLDSAEGWSRWEASGELRHQRALQELETSPLSPAVGVRTVGSGLLPAICSLIPPR